MTQVYAQLNLDPVRASVLSATRTMIAASRKKLKRPKVPKDKKGGLTTNRRGAEHCGDSFRGVSIP
jgi:hypothetical protein